MRYSSSPPPPPPSTWRFRGAYEQGCRNITELGAKLKNVGSERRQVSKPKPETLSPKSEAKQGTPGGLATAASSSPGVESGFMGFRV